MKAKGEMYSEVANSAEKALVVLLRLAGVLLLTMAVHPVYQRQGIGTKLVEQGLRSCAEKGHRIVVVLGHPKFYRRFGFSAKLAKPLTGPFSGEVWMALELVPGR